MTTETSSPISETPSAPTGTSSEPSPPDSPLILRHRASAVSISSSTPGIFRRRFTGASSSSSAYVRGRAIASTALSAFSSSLTHRLSFGASCATLVPFFEYPVIQGWCVLETSGADPPPDPTETLVPAGTCAVTSPGSFHDPSGAYHPNPLRAFPPWNAGQTHTVPAASTESIDPESGKTSRKTTGASCPRYRSCAYAPSLGAGLFPGKTGSISGLSKRARSGAPIRPPAPPANVSHASSKSSHPATK